MQKITIAGQIQLPKDAEEKEDVIERVRDALRELSGLVITKGDGSNWVSVNPFQETYLSDDGELKMTIHPAIIYLD
jgi:hypothetical protein